MDSGPDLTVEGGRDSGSDATVGNHSGSSDGGDSGSDGGTNAEAGGSTAGARSCAPGGMGMSNCGIDGGESCCTSLEVPGGAYFRTYDPEVYSSDAGTYVLSLAADGGPADEADPATVSGFRLDKYLVTVGRFRQFMNAVLPTDGGAGWLPGAGSGKHTHLNGGQGLVNVGQDAGIEYEIGWLTSDNNNVAPTNASLFCVDNGIPAFATWTMSPGSQENLPISCANWWEAYAFCIWDVGFLTSEAEWEYAAAGWSQQREYPWGSTDPSYDYRFANYACDYGPVVPAMNCASCPQVPTGPLGTCTGVANIAPVGTATLGAGLWGQLDLAGSVWEWTLDWWDGPQVPYFDPCTDCAYLSIPAPPLRIVRGGFFGIRQDDLEPSYSQTGDPTSREASVGFRCARAPQ